MLSLQYLHVWTSESRLTYVSQPGSLNSSSKITKNEITLWFLLLFDVSHNIEFVKNSPTIGIFAAYLSKPREGWPRLLPFDRRRRKYVEFQ